MQTLSLNGSKYFLIFVDDFTRMTWVYFLKEKSNAFFFFFFKQFKVLVENQCGCFILTLRTDRDGEFTSKEFSVFCSEMGIRRRLTTSYAPQQNGVAERKNRTMVEMARSIIKYKGLPKSYWVEAVATTVYLINRSPTRAVEGRTPYEAWNGRKPNVSHWRIFGSIAYAFALSEQRQKLDDKSIKCIFIGYSEEFKGYRLYNPDSEKLIISRDVIFNENDAWNWQSKEI